jgi:hypothetical protein
LKRRAKHTRSADHGRRQPAAITFRDLRHVQARVTPRLFSCLHLGFGGTRSNNRWMSFRLPKAVQRDLNKPLPADAKAQAINVRISCLRHN